MFIDANCFVCKTPLSRCNPHIEFFDAKTGRYPSSSSPDTTTWRFACEKCDTSAYAVPFDRLLQDPPFSGVDHWQNHLSRKRWFNPECARALDDAYRCALALKAADEYEPKRLADVAKPQPKPRAPKSKPTLVVEARKITSTVRARVMERDHFRCRRCGAGPAAATLEVDHVVPVAKGGTADESNLQTLCATCNNGKRDRDPHAHDFGDR